MVANRQGSRKERGMGPTMKVLVVAALMVVLLADAALAASPLVVRGTDHAEQIKGTEQDEAIYGLGGAGEITDGLGTDAVYGGRGKDNLIGYGGDAFTDRFYGGRGDDLIQPGDVPAIKDHVRCGPGTGT